MSDFDGHNGLPTEDDADRLKARNEWSRRGMAEREARRQRQHEEAQQAGASLVGALEFVAGLIGGRSGEGRDASGRKVVLRHGRAEYAPEDEGIDVTQWLRRKE